MNIADLTNAKRAKFREITATIAFQLGYGNFDDLSLELRADVEREADEAIENWDESEPGDGHTIKYPIQNLLAEHYELCERILDTLDEKRRF
jgi:DNA-binding MurR/RpiR family transcriptional regulator